MVAGLAFLSKKSFNPKNLSNQKTVWEARERKKKEENRIQERETQLKREREDEELARVRHGETGGEKVSLSFMYTAPPVGTADNLDKSNETVISGTSNLLERQPGDDAAAAAFRAMLAGSMTIQDAQHNEETFAFSNSSGAALQGTTVDRNFPDVDGRSALEKAVGRKDGNSSALTLEQQVARFPQLQHAPMAKGMKGTDVQVNFKPLGTQLRNVQCLVCGVWGHSKGDRECSKSGWDPFSLKGPIVPTRSAISKERTEVNGNARPIAKSEKRRRDNSPCKNVDSDDTRRRKEKKRRHKEQKRQRQRSPSLSDFDRTRRSMKDDDRSSRRKEHKKERKKKKSSRFDSDSD